MDILPGNPAFWLLASAMTAVALAFVLPRLWRGSRDTEGASRTAINAAIYRAEIEELARSRDTGALAADAYAEARAELERRLLHDTDVDPPAAAAAGATRRTAVAVALLLPLLAFGLYALFGEPSAILDDADAGIPAAAATASRDELARHVERHPRDGRGWVLLARAEAAADRFAPAVEAYRRALEVAPKVRRDPGIWCEYADALGMAQGGRLSGTPREFVMRALALDPAHPRALEMAGSAAYEAGEFAAAAGYWRELARRLPEGSPSQRELAAAIARADRLALVGDHFGSRARQ